MVPELSDWLMHLSATMLRTVSRARIPVATELNKVSAKFSGLMALTEGDTIGTNHRVQRPVNLSIGGLDKFYGKIATGDRRMAVQITGRNKQDISKAAA